MTVKIDGSGTVGIGTTSPAEELHVNGSTPSIRLSDTAGSNLITRITNSNGDLFLDADFGGSTGDIIFRSNGEKMRVAANGAIKLASGCPGIDFSGIQTNASGMTSETLDSYEEGTWTPTTASSHGAIATVGTTSGRYVKIGRSVTVHFIITITDADTAAGAYLIFGNLPFTASNTWNQPGVCREQSVNGNLNTAQITGNATTGIILGVTNGGVIVDSGNYQCTITYEAQ